LRVARVILSLALCGVAGAAEWRTEKIGVRVVDDAGQPVGGAAIGMGVTGSGPKGIARGFTDTNGLFAARFTMVGSLYLRAEKPGYYRTSGELWDGPSSTERAPPTNEYTVVLKRIVNPVPMVHRKVLATVPAVECPFGFDLEKGDWTAPHGAGRCSDFVVKAEKRFVSPDDMEIGIAVVFTNRGDGIQAFQSTSLIPYVAKSDLAPPQSAPTDGYLSELKSRISRVPGQPMVTSYGAGRGFIVRIRSMTNELGEVVSACHGWINGEINVSGYHIPTVLMGLEYCLNTNPASRSLEPQRR